MILKQSILEMIFGTVQLFCRTVYIHCCYNIPEYQLHPSLNQILNINSNFFLVQKFCEIYGGDLAVIESEEEQMWIESYLKSTWTNCTHPTKSFRNTYKFIICTRIKSQCYLNPRHKI